MIRPLCLYAKALLGLSQRPVHVTCFVTGRCPLRCKTCFYAHHLHEPGRDLTLPEIQALAPSLRGVLWLAVTGGEPFMRDDLGEVIETLVQGARPPYMTLVTNGYFPDRVAPVVERALAARPGQVVRVSVSLDGVGGLPDEVRGIPGSFDRACETIRILSELRDAHKRVHLLVCTCYNALNQNHVEEIPSFLREHFGEVPWDFALVRGAPRDPETQQGLDVERYFRLKRQFCQATNAGPRPGAIERLIAAKNRRLIDAQESAVGRGVMPSPCRAGSLSAVIREHGEVIACEIDEPAMGNLRDFDMDMAKLWRSNQARQVPRRLRSCGCVCGHECNLTTNLFFHPRSLAGLAADLLRPRSCTGDV